MRTFVLTLVSILVAGGLGFAQPSGSSASATQITKKLPYGVEDILKLTRAGINDDIIVKYIQNTGTTYNLGPETIVYLKDQGITDKVLGAMMDQPKETSSGTTSTWRSQAPAQTPAQQQPAPTYVQPPQPDPAPPAPAPRSTLHIIPYHPASYYYPGYSYYPDWGYRSSFWYGPSISLGFGFGFGHGFHQHHRRGCW